ncbi:hypothetical protein [Streptosporangium sp. NPDC002524]
MDVDLRHELVTIGGAGSHAVLDRARDLLRRRHSVAHATSQVEPAGHLGW